MGARDDGVGGRRKAMAELRLASAFRWEAQRMLRHPTACWQPMSARDRLGYDASTAHELEGAWLALRRRNR